jgi:VanZ family protein
MIKLKGIVNHFWLELSVLMLVTITVLSLHPLEHLPEAPGSDKTHHLVAYAALAFPAALRKPKQWQVILIGFALYSGLIELVQPHVNRYGEWLDFLANISGLFVGTNACIGNQKTCETPQINPSEIGLFLAKNIST